MTTPKDYILHAPESDGVDYFMKPLHDESLLMAMQRLKNSLQEQTMTENMETLLYNMTKAVSFLDMRLCLPTLKGFIIVKVDEIIYCEAQRSYTVFYITQNRKLVVSKPLFEYDRILNDATFVRIHKSFLINMSHVKEYLRGDGGTVVMSNNIELDVSRGKKEMFLTRIKESFRY